MYINDKHIHVYTSRLIKKRNVIIFNAQIYLHGIINNITNRNIKHSTEDDQQVRVNMKAFFKQDIP